MTNDCCGSKKTILCPKKRVLFLTATRADFGKLQALIQKTQEEDSFESFVFVTGMHTLARYGSTYLEIEKAGIRNIFIYINQRVNTSQDMDIVLANTIHGLGNYIREVKVDMIVVHGDRIEALAGAIVGAMNNILVAHIEGGELSGTVDELVRHAVTKLAHIHLVANEESQKRVIQLGEVTESVAVIGSPDIDIMLSDQLPTLEEAKEWYNISFSEYGIFCYHPVTTDRDPNGFRIRAVVQALIDSKLNFVVIYPNNDAGSSAIMDALMELEHNSRFHLLPSLRFQFFLVLLKQASVIVGNSSAGIREAPVYGVPTINIGSRQKNRFESPSIVNVPEDRELILGALSNIPRRKEPCMHFGNGQSAPKFMEFIKRPETWSIPIQKQFKDLPDLCNKMMGRQ